MFYISNKTKIGCRTCQEQLHYIKYVNVWNQTEIDSESVHKNVKCQQVKPQYNEKALEDMAIVTVKQDKYRLDANTTKNTR
jgi:hypothetical protein